VKRASEKGKRKKEKEKEKRKRKKEKEKGKLKEIPSFLLTVGKVYWFHFLFLFFLFFFFFSFHFFSHGKSRKVRDSRTAGPLGLGQGKG